MLIPTTPRGFTWASFSSTVVVRQRLATSKWNIKIFAYFLTPLVAVETTAGVKWFKWEHYSAETSAVFFVFGVHVIFFKSCNISFHLPFFTFLMLMFFIYLCIYSFHFEAGIKMVHNQIFIFFTVWNLSQDCNCEEGLHKYKPSHTVLVWWWQDWSK